MSEQIDFSQHDVAQLAQYYIELRQYKAELKESIQAQLDQTNEKMVEIEHELQRRLITSGATSLKTPNGTVMQVKKKKFVITDLWALRRYIIENAELALNNFVPARITNSDLDLYLQDNPGATIPPGVSMETVHEISVRRSR